MPTRVAGPALVRKLYIKITPKRVTDILGHSEEVTIDYNVGSTTVTKSGAIDLSGKVASIPENVDISAVHLSKVSLTGLTDAISITDTDAVIGRTTDMLTKTELKYSLSGFKVIIQGAKFNTDPEVQRLVSEFG